MRVSISTIINMLLVYACLFWLLCPVYWLSWNDISKLKKISSIWCSNKEYLIMISHKDLKLVGISWIYITLCFGHAMAIEKLTKYYHRHNFNDKLCLKSAIQLKGMFPSLSTCASRCKATDDCFSFFYTTLDLECFSINSVLTSRDGCETRSGSRYFSSHGKVSLSLHPSFKRGISCLILTWEFHARFRIIL